MGVTVQVKQLRHLNMVRDTTDLSPPSKGFSPGFHSPSQHKASSKHYAAFYLILPIHQKLAKFYKLQGRGLQSQGDVIPALNR